MQAFVRVIEKGSFSAVAKERGIGQPAVSKQISSLEEELGTELIHRTSRSIALTEAGRDFYESALRILDDFESSTSRIGRGQTAPKGLIRVTVPPTFARLHMVSKLPAFFSTYPTWQSSLAHRKARRRWSKTASTWRSTRAIFQTPTWWREDSPRRGSSWSRRLSTSRDTAHRNRRTISTAFDPSFLSSGARYSRGDLGPDEMRSA